MTTDNKLFYSAIPKRSHLCSKEQEMLVTGSEYVSVLLQGENKDYSARKDFCLSCWDQIKDSSEFKSAIQWKSKVPSKKEERKDTLHRDEKALLLFKERVKGTTQEELQEAFILALFLKRQRLLALRKEVIKAGKSYQIYEELATEEVFSILKPEPSSLQIKQLQEKIAQKLKA